VDFEIENSDFEKAKKYLIRMLTSGIGYELSKEFIKNGENMVDSSWANFIYLRSGSVFQWIIR
jgi:hypothetical protein